MAQTGRPLVYGGGNKGLMGIISSAVAKQGGHVTGIMPYAMVAAGGEKIKIEDNQEKDRNMLDVLSTCPDSKVRIVASSYTRIEADIVPDECFSRSKWFDIFVS